MVPKMKNELKKLYEAPPPPGKRAFLRNINPRPLRVRHILWMQISYISKLEWVISAALFGTIVVMSWLFKPAVLSASLAMMPFLAVAGISESMRSVTYGMEELEMTARFSLKSIILARMGIVGMENLVFALAAALFVHGNFVHVVLYLLTPYLITVYGSLLIVRNNPGREGLFICMGFSVAVSLAAGWSSFSYRWIYEERFAVCWMAAVAALACMNVRESRRIVKFMECYS